MVRLILVRHGETAWNTEHRFQGQTDVPLNEIGRRQASRLASRLADEEIHVIYSSDLRRAWETATAINARHDVTLRSEPRLREIDFGAWEGLTYDEIQEGHAGVWDAWLDDPMNVAVPDGELLAEVVTRIQLLLDGITSEHAEQNVLLVGHGGSLQTLLGLLLGLNPQARWQFRLDTTSLSELYLYEEGTILTLLNDTCHLSEVEDAG
ncbi:MAG: Phosphoserine phosphatase 1 [Anaerolineales bacterium]|nr:Phosphoserine phosphatase 1 [Anaerolineales bacterium]